MHLLLFTGVGLYDNVGSNPTENTIGIYSLSMGADYLLRMLLVSFSS